MATLTCRALCGCEKRAAMAAPGLSVALTDLLVAVIQSVRLPTAVKAFHHCYPKAPHVTVDVCGSVQHRFWRLRRQ